MMQNIYKFAAGQTRPTVTNTRISRSHMLYKITVLNLAKFVGKYLCWSPLFNKGADLRPLTLLKGHSSTGAFL